MKLQIRKHFNHRGPTESTRVSEQIVRLGVSEAVPPSRISLPSRWNGGGRPRSRRPKSLIVLGVGGCSSCIEWAPACD